MLKIIGNTRTNPKTCGIGGVQCTGWTRQLQNETAWLKLTRAVPTDEQLAACKEENGRINRKREQKKEKPHLYLLEGLFLGERNWSSWSSWLFSENHKQTRNGGAVDKQLVTR